MAKNMISAAAAVVAFSGVVHAIPQLNYSNSTTLGVASATAGISSILSSATANSTATSTSSSASSTATNIKYCPNLDGEFIVGPLDIKYEITCDTTHLGVIIDLTLQKRATPDSLTDCLTECSELTQCIAAAYDTNDPTCYLFSSVGAAVTESGFQFAEKASALASSTSSAAATATAVSSGVSSNGTSNSTTPLEDLFCPQLDSQVYSDGNGVSYIIECGDNHVGTVIDVAYAKRATAATTSILDCMALCDASAECEGTGYNTAAGTCTLFSAVGAEYYDANVDFAVKVADATTTAVAGAAATAAGSDIVTGVVYTTTTSTIYSCAATVTDCPLTAGADSAVVTDVVVAYTTICPASDLPAGAVTTSIAAGVAGYAAVTATVYSTTVSTIYSCAATVTNCPLTATSAASASAASAASATGADAAAASAAGASAAASVASAAGVTAASTVTSMVAVATSVVNYAIYSTVASTVATSVIGTAGTATYAGPSATSSGLVAYTGAADVLSAGMGMAGALVAGAAFLL